ncbi:MAG: hypothetical protein PHW76_04265 [Alphaproteobacteria bacterium]|nr:hypothetical protein [Alphaproteobacteria bacterium]
MRISTGVLAAACLLSVTPAFAGNIDFNNGEAAWHSSRCQKPIVPMAGSKITSETRGNQLNALIAERNAFADAVQAYMNCVSNEAENDQAVIGQGISAGAQKEIDAAKAELDKLFGSPRTAESK